MRVKQQIQYYYKKKTPGECMRKIRCHCCLQLTAFWTWDNLPGYNSECRLPEKKWKKITSTNFIIEMPQGALWIHHGGENSE